MKKSDRSVNLDSFGSTLRLSGASEQSPTSQYLNEHQIYDYRHRMYHPQLGRFLQMDPTGFDAGDMNLFRYCSDDPVDRSDPTGLLSAPSGAGRDFAMPRDWLWDFACFSDSGNASQLTFGEFQKLHNQPPGMDAGQRGDGASSRLTFGGMWANAVTEERSDTTSSRPRLF